MRELLRTVSRYVQKSQRNRIDSDSDVDKEDALSSNSDIQILGDKQAGAAAADYFGASSGQRRWREVTQEDVQTIQLDQSLVEALFSKRQQRRPRHQA